MRRLFARTLADLADSDDRILLLTADLGFGALEPFRDRHPDRFLNCGIAECNMVGTATGLAKEGYTPYCWSIAPFLLHRAYEFILNGPILHNLPVRLVAVGLGQEYGENGPTHWSDDFCLVTKLPERKLQNASDVARLGMLQQMAGPVLLRLSKVNLPV